MDNDYICCLFFNDPDKKNTFTDNMNKRIKTFCVLKNVGVISRIIRKIHLKSNLPGIRIWFTDWYKEISKYEVIVVVATGYSIPVLRWLKRHTRNNVRLINYYWDEIHASGYPVVCSEFFDNWSFNPMNSKEFNMKCNPQFWIKTMDLKADEFEYDVSFAGGDRNGKYLERTEQVVYLYKLLHDKYRTFFWYITESEEVDSAIKRDRDMALIEFLDTIRKSKVIIELTEPNNPWLTQRTLYAISNRKKIITNNKDIKDELFYNADNIFILGEDDINTIDDFISSPFVDTDEEVLQEYELQNWINRFIADESFEYPV